MDVLTAIKKYKREHGRIITEVKLAKMLGISRDTVRDRIKKLIETGQLVHKNRYQEGHFDTVDN
jgi:DNA-binding Lrp family transcriptional regulator